MSSILPAAVGCRSASDRRGTAARSASTPILRRSSSTSSSAVNRNSPKIHPATVDARQPRARRLGVRQAPPACCLERTFRRALELPDWLVRPGASFQDYLRYRSARGDFGDDGETAIAIRMQHVREREPAKREQMLPNGTVLEMRRDPMPGGGFVTTYTDITDRQIAAVQLRKPRRAWNAALPSVPPSSPRSMSSFVRRFTSALKSRRRCVWRRARRTRRT